MQKIGWWLNPSFKLQLILFAGSLLILFNDQVAALENPDEYLKASPMVRISQANDSIPLFGREATDRETSNILTLEIISSLKDQPVITELILGNIPIPLFGSGYKRFWTGFEFTQTMLTPDHPNEEGPKMRERPPAGLLLYGISTNGEHFDEKTFRRLGGWGGVIGPMSRAGQLQNWVHDNLLRGNEAALCWKHEKSNTPVFITGIDQSRKILEYHPWSNENISFNTITKAGLYLGTSSSAASLVEFQFGWNPGRHNQYGVTRIGPQYTNDLGLNPLGLGKPLSSAFLQSLFLYSSLRMDLIIYDQTLTDREITPRPLVYKLIYGLGIVFNLWKYPISASLAATTETRRYDEQQGSHSMVTLSLSGFFPSAGREIKKP